MLKVSEIPSYEEFYGLIDNELSDEDFQPNTSDDDLKEIILIALGLLQDFYLEVKYYTEYDILSDRFEQQLSKFNLELKEQLLVLLSDYMDSVSSDYDLEYNLPSHIVDTKVDLEEIIDAGVDSVTDTLYADLKDKATFYKEMAITTGMFSLHSNFRRAVRKLSNVVDYNSQYLAKRIDRSYNEFVYGQEALFYWICSGRNTCSWCYSIERESPLPLSMLPIDHPNGHCTIKPVLPDVYSDEYLEVVLR